MDEGQGARAVYDPMELCRRIVVCFSTPELTRLAESLGVRDAVTWGRGTSEAALSLVRFFERKRDLETLVMQLRRERPLVEWPEPAGPSQWAPPGATEPGAPAALETASGSAGSELPQKTVTDTPPGAAPGAPDAPDAPVTAGAPDALGIAFIASPALGGLAAEAPAPTTSGSAHSEPRADRPPPSAALPSSGASLNAPPSQAAPVWPGTVSTEATPQAAGRGLDPRILIVVSACTLLAAVVAFIAGRAGAPAAAPSSATAAPGGEAASARANPDGAAARIADAIERSLANVARDCEIPVRGAPTEDILLRAFNQCGPAPASPRRPAGNTMTAPGEGPGAPGEPGRADAQGDRPAANDQPAAGRPRTAAPKTADAPGGTGPDAACMGRCTQEHQSCKGQCGKEPTQSTLYAEYQGCLSRCLMAASKCRLGCQ